jgi:hypothetical protein
MNIFPPMEFLLRGAPASTTLASDRALHNEVVFPAVACFEALARAITQLFFEHEALEAFTLTCLVRPSWEESADMLTVHLNQHLKCSTLGVTAFADQDALVEFLENYAPMHRMGSGTFTLRRDAPVVQKVLNAYAAESPVPDDALDLVDEQVHTLARRLQQSFKVIHVDVTGGQLLG